MIEFASASLIGVEITVVHGERIDCPMTADQFAHSEFGNWAHTGDTEGSQYFNEYVRETRTLLFRHTEKYPKSAHPDLSLSPDNWVAASFIILAESEERIITAALSEHYASVPRLDKYDYFNDHDGFKRMMAAKKAKLTTSKIAMRVQRIERRIAGSRGVYHEESRFVRDAIDQYDGTDLRSIRREERPMTDEESAELKMINAMRGTRGFKPKSAASYMDVADRGFATDRVHTCMTRNEFAMYSPRYRRVVMI